MFIRQLLTKARMSAPTARVCIWIITVLWNMHEICNLFILSIAYSNAGSLDSFFQILVSCPPFFYYHYLLSNHCKWVNKCNFFIAKKRVNHVVFFCFLGLHEIRSLGMGSWKLETGIVIFAHIFNFSDILLYKQYHTYSWYFESRSTEFLNLVDFVHHYRTARKFHIFIVCLMWGCLR